MQHGEWETTHCPTMLAQSIPSSLADMRTCSVGRRAARYCACTLEPRPESASSPASAAVCSAWRAASARPNAGSTIAWNRSSSA